MAAIGDGPTSRAYDFREFNLILLVVYLFTSIQLVLKTMLVAIYVADTVTDDLRDAAKELGGVKVTFTSVPFLLKKVILKRCILAFSKLVLSPASAVLETSFFMMSPTQSSFGLSRTSDAHLGTGAYPNSGMGGARLPPLSSGKKGKSRKARQMDSAKKEAVARAHRASLEAIKAGDALKEAEEEFRIASGANTPMSMHHPLVGSRFAELLSPVHNSSLPSPNRSQIYTGVDSNSGSMTAVLTEKLEKLHDEGVDESTGVSESEASAVAEASPLSPPNRTPTVPVGGEQATDIESAPLNTGDPPVVPAIATLKLMPPGTFSPLSSMPASPKVLAAEAVYRQKLDAAAAALAATLEFVEADDDVNADVSDTDGLVQYTREEMLAMRESPLVPHDIDESYEYYVLHSTIRSLNAEVASFGESTEGSSRIYDAGGNAFDGEVASNAGDQWVYGDHEPWQSASEYRGTFNSSYSHAMASMDGGEPNMARRPSRDSTSRADSEGRWDKRDTPIEGKLYEDRYSESMGDYNVRRGFHSSNHHRHHPYHHQPYQYPYPGEHRAMGLSASSAGLDGRSFYSSAPDPGRHRSKVGDAGFIPLMANFPKYPHPGLASDHPAGERPDEPRSWTYRGERRPAHNDTRFDYDRIYGGDDRRFHDGRAPPDDIHERDYHPQWRTDDRRYHAQGGWRYANEHVYPVDRRVGPGSRGGPTDDGVSTSTHGRQRWQGSERNYKAYSDTKAHALHPADENIDGAMFGDSEFECVDDDADSQSKDSVRKSLFRSPSPGRDDEDAAHAGASEAPQGDSPRRRDEGPISPRRKRFTISGLFKRQRGKSDVEPVVHAAEQRKPRDR